MAAAGAVVREHHRAERIHSSLFAVAQASLGHPLPDTPHHVRQVGAIEQDAALAEIRDRDGPAGLLLAGRHIDELQAEPLVLSLLNSSSPAVLLEKIAALNRYFHSDHRHRVIRLEPHEVELEHVAVRGAAPSPDQSLFVCGLYLALLHRIGCSDLECAFPEKGGVGRTVYQHGEVAGEVPPAVHRWQISWSAVRAARELPGLDSVLLARLPPALDDEDTSRRVTEVLASDLAHKWRVGDVAAQLACSARTLQRRLSEQGTTFTELLVEVRVAEAERQLLETDASVSTIGYATGFSDSAHFTRTFRARTGRTPSSVRGQRRC
ncbi:MAG: AraC family transcriptional regulator [Microthrixaceae bacterium]|nr:AraC family transcriptional regulator [Microthrixaceae bacterium]